MVRDLAQTEAEIIRSLSTYVTGKIFFDGCTIFLKLWTLDNFYIRLEEVNVFLGNGNKIDNHPRKMLSFTTPVGLVDWQIFDGS